MQGACPASQASGSLEQELRGPPRAGLLQVLSCPAPSRLPAQEPIQHMLRTQCPRTGTWPVLRAGRMWGTWLQVGSYSHR